MNAIAGLSLLILLISLGAETDIPLIRSWMEACDYRGMHEVEIFSANNWWKRDPDEVLLTCKLRHETAS